MLPTFLATGVTRWLGDDGPLRLVARPAHLCRRLTVGLQGAAGMAGFPHCVSPIPRGLHYEDPLRSRRGYNTHTFLVA